jgi:hypothetical protein
VGTREALGSVKTQTPPATAGFFIGLTALPVFVALDPGHGRGQEQQNENTADNLKYHHENDPCERVGTKTGPI